MSIFREIKFNVIMTAVLSVIYGIILILFPMTTYKVICRIVAVALLVIGLICLIQYIKKDVLRDFYRKELVSGLIYITIGIVAMIKVDLLEDIIMLLLGLLVLFSGIVKIQYSLDVRRLCAKDAALREARGWVAVLLLGVINVVFGFLLVLEPQWASGIIVQLIGVGMLYSGVTDLITTLYVERRIRRIKRSLEQAMTSVQIIEDEV